MFNYSIDTRRNAVTYYPSLEEVFWPRAAKTQKRLIISERKNYKMLYLFAFLCLQYPKHSSQNGYKN